MLNIISTYEKAQPMQTLKNSIYNNNGHLQLNFRFRPRNHLSRKLEHGQNHRLNVRLNQVHPYLDYCFKCGLNCRCLCLVTIPLRHFQSQLHADHVLVRLSSNYTQRNLPQKVEYKKAFKLQTLSFILFISGSSYFVTVFVMLQSKWMRWALLKGGSIWILYFLLDSLHKTLRTSK